MHFLSLTLPTPEENLALDEAILDEAESHGVSRESRVAESLEVLRIWEPPATMVVVGRSTRLEDEVHVKQCRADRVPILRRPSGGAAIVAGPGCLMYAVILSRELRPEIRGLDGAHRFVLERTAEALAPLVPGVRMDGTSDLVLDGRKFSGNSLRVKRRFLLYHGTLLYNSPIAKIARYLKLPPRQPKYRAGRNHADFLTNLPATAEALTAALRRAWQADSPLADETDWPRDRVAALVRERYGRRDWNEEYP